MALLCNDVSHWLGAISILQRLSLAGRKPRIIPAMYTITGQKWTFIQLMVTAVTNHFCHGILNHWQLNSLFSSLCRLTKNILELCITGLLWEESTCDWWIPLTKCQWCGKYFHVMMTADSSPFLTPYAIKSSVLYNELTLINLARINFDSYPQAAFIASLSEQCSLTHIGCHADCFYLTADANNSRDPETTR